MDRSTTKAAIPINIIGGQGNVPPEMGKSGWTEGVGGGVEGTGVGGGGTGVGVGVGVAVGVGDGVGVGVNPAYTSAGL